MAPELFMIHGMWGAGWNWDKYRRFFAARRYECRTPTLPFHDQKPGTTPNPKLGTASLVDYANELDASILIRDSNSLPIIFGHSMGGLLAQILAARGLARALVLLAPAAPQGIFALRFSVLRCFLPFLCRWRFWNRHHRLPYKHAVDALYRLVPEDERRELYERSVPESARAVLEIALPLGPARVDAASIECPILVIAGAEDPITPPAIVRKVARRYRKSFTYLECAGHAHWLLGEPGWEKIAECIAFWLRQQGFGAD